ncbi:ACP S-malonyltransferase [Tepidibacillus fermentans]|uniref:Malonyl CoA-acyl carrier protein transacylase n=1 Tax=Tepidibacillus fermentans TaxID=1281767 RepID=A0A4R3K8A3_9BACI|nr:[acyl-carrier-protein] S-malonyltransferase [Tepidibacillus fermentans]
MKTAILFPGQGSQFVGMGYQFYQEFEEAREIYKQADDILDFPLSKLCFEGPEEQLRITMYTQPAIYVTSLAIWSVVKKLGILPDFMAGHSLGEYTALTAAESIPYEEALRLVEKRGLFMEEAVPHGEGTMAAVMGIDRKGLEKVCRQVTEEGNVVELANINSPGQIVISGTKLGVELAAQRAKELGARRIIPLSVSGPFHSRLMKPARDRLQPLVTKLQIQEGRTPVVMNVTGRSETEPMRMKSNLIEQVVSPVLWTDSIEWMIAQGVDTFIEVGPSKVLSGLVKKINRTVTTYSIEDLDSFYQFQKEWS